MTPDRNQLALEFFLSIKDWLLTRWPEKTQEIKCIEAALNTHPVTDKCDGLEYIISEHKRFSAIYVDATVGATARRDYRCGLAEELRKRLTELEKALAAHKAQRESK